MDPLSPSKYPNRDGLPLSQLSPERVNGRVARMDDTTKPTVSTPFTSPIRRKADDTSFFNPGIPQSPSLPEITSVRSQIRMNTDVSGLVKRFEHLDVRDREAESYERRKKQEEALSRANIAREEAESEARKCKEELRAQKKEYEECKSRERKACRRIEILMDEMDRAKDQWSSQSSVYEKEIRRARKEAFKSSSTVLKYQEESKRSSNEANVLRTKLDLADRKVSKSEEEKFTAEYQLAAVQEELERLRANLRIAEEERERWKKSLEEEDIIRIASQGSIALPAHTNDDLDPTDEQIEGRSAAVPPKDTNQSSLAEVRGQIILERRRRQAAESLADFLQLECQFRCCRCILDGASGTHRSSQADEMQQTRDSQPFGPDVVLQDRRDDAKAADPSSSTHEDLPPEVHTAAQGDEMQLYEEEQDYSNDLDANTVQHLSGVRHESQSATPSIKALTSVELGPRNDQPASHENLRPATPSSTHQLSTESSSWREISKTTRVPMHFTPSTKQPDHAKIGNEDAVTPKSPHQISTTTDADPQKTPKSYPFDREAALAAIEQRRRAKSFAQSNNTPKRPVVGRVADRRDISAPAITG